MTKYKLGGALFAALQKTSPYYHLLVQRLLRLIPREALGTKDGLKLEEKARRILPFACHQAMSQEIKSAVFKAPISTVLPSLSSRKLAQC